MDKAIYSLLIVMLISQVAISQNNMKYPHTKKVDKVDTYFDTEVADPYRWLEDDNAEDTKAWVKAQNKVTFNYLDKIPFREKLKDYYQKIWDYPKESAPFKEGDNYFVHRNTGLQDQSVVYIMKEADE
ncbi:MAG: S9 family peptidase, partial [Bacteroidota bacterium]